MGLTKNSVGRGAVDFGIDTKKERGTEKVIALAGNPNVGKSTIFNALTGMNQHTGNWPGKTVSAASGRFSSGDNEYVLVDIPGTYSLMAHSAEEEVARDFLCFGEPDAAIVVCDATCLERNLNLVLQSIEICDNVLLCVNMMDEAKSKHITPDLPRLSKELGIPVVGCVGQKKSTLKALVAALDSLVSSDATDKISVDYGPEVERAISIVSDALGERYGKKLSSRWLALRLIDEDESLNKSIRGYLGEDPCDIPEIREARDNARAYLTDLGIDPGDLKDKVVGSLYALAGKIAAECVSYESDKYTLRDGKIDRALTGKYTAYPFMILLLAIVLLITIAGANYPSELLSRGLFFIQDCLTELFARIGAPDWLHGAVVLGMYRVLAWVVSVMLPPMAIFFPLFTLLEDSGYLPRIAYNLDKPFKKCAACGKQALTMCMGFGCNAAGVVGCRIIDSPRERLIAILTNNFAPCNGRFPMLISIITMFLVTGEGGVFSSVASAGILTAVIVCSVFATLGVSKLLSKTILRGVPSSFTLELPPYRKPQPGKIIVRSIFDRTLFVLGRAATVAAPAGLVIWIMANVTVGGNTLLGICSGFLDPLGHLMGLDGVILMAFILGFPANEIVIPIIIMAYMSSGTLTEISDTVFLRELFVANGWTPVTAICMLIFSVMHWPCSTTLLTVKKETGSIKQTLLAFALPTACGMILCMTVNAVAALFGA